MFRVARRNIGDIEPFMVLSKKAGEAYLPGEALKQGADGVTKCGATEIPQYICVGEGDGVSVIPVLETTEFEVPYTAAPSVGTKVTLHTDGLQVTATATGGVFTVVSVDSAKGRARGYFK